MSVNIQKGSNLSFHGSKTVEQAKIANDNGIYFAFDETSYGTLLVNGKIFGTSNSNYLSGPTSGDLYDFIISQGAAGEGAGANALSEAKKYTDDSINALNVNDTAVEGQYVSSVSEANGKITVNRMNLPTLSDLGGITPTDVDTKISTALNDLDVDDTEVENQYVSYVSQENGKIKVKRGVLPTLSDLGGITPTNVDTKISDAIGNLNCNISAPVNEFIVGIKQENGKITSITSTELPTFVTPSELEDVIDGLDVDDTAVEGKYVSSVSEANGKITVNRKDLPTLSSLGGITPTDVDTKISTAINNLDVDDAEVPNQYVSSVSQTDGKITVTHAAFPNLGDLDGITPAEVDEKISDALNDLDVDDTEVTNQYVSYVSQENGKIKVKRGVLPTLGDLGGITPTDVDTKISTTINGLDAEVTGNNITVFTYTNGALSNYSSTPKVVETDGKLTSLTVLSQATNLVTKEYVDHLHTVLLGDGNLKDTVDTITEISYWLDNDLNDAASLTLSLAQLTSKVENNEESFNNDIENIYERIDEIISGTDQQTRVQLVEKAYLLYNINEGSVNTPVYFKDGAPIRVTSIDNTLINKTAGSSTLSWGTEVTLATIAGQDIKAKLPDNPNTDTTNTAGSTDTSSKIFLVGTTSQTNSSQTYSHDTVYIGTDGCLYSNGEKVITVTEHNTLSETVNEELQELQTALTWQ